MALLRPRISRPKANFLINPALTAAQIAAARPQFSPVAPVRPPVTTPPVMPPATTPTAPSAPQYPDFYNYTDPYGSLLTDLAAARDKALAGLKADLEGRTTAVQGIVNSERSPLNANYAQAIQEAAAVNDAVANRLGVQSTEGQKSLMDRLALIGADPNAATADLSKYYSGLGGANYAMDSGDVQRLIGRKAEENTLLDKQPLLVRQQLEQGYAKDIADLLDSYSGQELSLKTNQAQDKAAYDKAKFDYSVQQANTAADTKAAKEKTYWDNYWNKQNLLFRKWQTNIASGDKKAADATRKQIAELQRQSQIDIANIRADASASKTNTPKPFKNQVINGHAATFDPNTGTYYYPGTQNPIPQNVLDKWSKTGSGGTGSNISRQRVYQQALSAVIDPKTKLIVSGVNPAGYNADWTMTRIIHGVLKTYGINPNTAQGRSITAAVMSQASGHRFAQDKTSQYQYDPNWVKGAQAAAAKKKTKQNYNKK